MDLLALMDAAGVVEPHPLAVAAFLFALGACVGSFLNVVVWRLPRGESLVSPPSHCPKCDHKLAWYDNIPIFGWLMLRGRCRYCRAGISVRYPLVEAVTGLLFVLYYVLIYQIGLGPCYSTHDALGQVMSRRGIGPLGESWPYFALYLFLLAALLAASLIDAELFVIPMGIPHLAGLMGLIVHAAWDRPGVPGSLSVGWAGGAVAMGGGLGLVVSLLALWRGWLKVSFPQGEPMLEVDRPAAEREIEQAKQEAREAPPLPPAYSRAEIRGEIGKEMLFLMPPMLGAGLWLAACAWAGPARAWWSGWMEIGWLAGLLGAVLGALVAAFVVWITRILGTLGFGRVAMGLGDVHLMFGVGAVIGAGASMVAFFLAPFFGILVALYLLISGSKREVPYGPYLSLATGFVLLFYCDIAGWLQVETAWQGLVYLLRGLFSGTPGGEI